MVARLGGKEQCITRWIEAALADGRLKTADRAFAAHQLRSLVKGLAFWPQLTMGPPGLAQAQQAQLVASSVDMFLAYCAKQ